jgi:hypothetical protein
MSLLLIGLFWGWDIYVLRELHEKAQIPSYASFAFWRLRIPCFVLLVPTDCTWESIPSGDTRVCRGKLRLSVYHMVCRRNGTGGTSPLGDWRQRRHNAPSRWRFQSNAWASTYSQGTYSSTRSTGSEALRWLIAWSIRLRGSQAFNSYSISSTWQTFVASLEPEVQY